MSRRFRVSWSARATRSRTARAVVGIGLIATLGLAACSAPVAAPVATAPQAPACVEQNSAGAGLLLIRVGCDRPPLFFLHSLGITAASMSQAPRTLELLKTLAADYGYGIVVGDVGGPASWDDPAALAALAALVSEYGGDAPPQFVAMSMGGSLLLRYSENNPVGTSVGLVSVTRWTAVIASVAGDRPPLPVIIDFAYHLWVGSTDEAVGVPRLGDSVHTLQGGHEELDWPAADIAAKLGGQA